MDLSWTCWDYADREFDWQVILVILWRVFHGDKNVIMSSLLHSAIYSNCHVKRSILAEFYNKHLGNIIYNHFVISFHIV